MRKEILLNEGWLFHRGDIPEEPIAIKEYADSKTERYLRGPASFGYGARCYPGAKRYDELQARGWVEVDLPHDFIVAGELKPDQNPGFGYLEYCNGWYRRSFTLPEGCEGKRVTLRFDGVAVESTVYLNGCLMHRNFSAYNSFEIDLSDYVHYEGENVIAVYVSTEMGEGWWYRGGGIYRDVTLSVTERVAIDLWGVYAPYRKISDTLWRVDLHTTCLNDSYDDVDVRAVSYIEDGEGRVVASAEGQGVLNKRDKCTLDYSCEVESPELWGVDHPYLYTVRTELYAEGVLVDRSRVRIGFREVQISAERGLLINGEPTFIKGLCGHQDFGLTGLAVPDNIAKYKVSMMKRMGANGYRTSHYQQTASYMDAFDEMGFIVLDEARWFESTPMAMEQLESLVKRDRNRPSVFFWSTSNEEYLHVTDEGRRIHRAIAHRICTLDPTRPVIAAVDKTPDKCTIYDDCELIGINYNLKIYDTVHKAYPHKPILATECCAVPTTRDWYFDSDGYGRTRDLDVKTAPEFFGNSRSDTMLHLSSRPYVIGGYQWVAFEHRGEAAWPTMCSRSGAIDIFLREKSGYWLNKSHWTEEPMVRIISHWSFRGLEGTERPVPVYTNCDEVELILNGRSLGRRSVEKYGYPTWTVPYEPGTLTAVGYRDGERVTEDERVSTGLPVSLELIRLDTAARANGRDIELFICRCLDGEGRVVPDASPTVSFSVGAPAVIVGTGSDNCDHTSVALPVRKMYMGSVTVGVKPAKGQSTLTLTATADNLGSGQITVTLTEGD